jgi:hypothetical protein
MCHNRDCFSSRNAINRHLQATGTTRTTKETGNTGDSVTTAGLFPPHVVAWHAAIHDFPSLSCALLAILVFVCRYAAEPPRTSETYIAQPAALPAIEARSPNPRRCGVCVCVCVEACVCAEVANWVAVLKVAAGAYTTACMPSFISLRLCGSSALLIGFLKGVLLSLL